MEINHLKFDTLDSTQLWLKENIISHLGSNTLVSTRIQSKGTGRLGNQWDQFGASLAFSILLKPCEPLTLTSLEIGIHLARFLESMDQEVFLKWPNDILIKEDDGFKKVGGILSHYHSPEVLIVGIGLNLDLSYKTSHQTKSFKFPPGCLNLDLSKIKEFYHSLPYEFYQHTLNNRVYSKEVITQWNKLCAHKDTAVKIVDGGSSFSGVFEGLGPNGEALVKGLNGVKTFISGSLLF
ncbi:MAG: BirA family biotin operon repressor/biotin-[acetyl-CoA-carboxylase] ligase [Bacteriovoracaceae bacterium]|jgi:BirA family biotin operon repressor/biotin-[acetyl-CoA-carboxylase] ligase